MSNVESITSLKNTRQQAIVNGDAAYTVSIEMLVENYCASINKEKELNASIKEMDDDMHTKGMIIRIGKLHKQREAIRDLVLSMQPKSNDDAIYQLIFSAHSVIEMFRSCKSDPEILSDTQKIYDGLVSSCFHLDEQVVKNFDLVCFLRDELISDCKY
jgi:hypothetical protein